MLRAVLFDFNGVLVDDEPIHLELFQRVLAEEGVALSAADYFARYLGLDDRSCFAAVLAAAGEAAAGSSSRSTPRLMRLSARKASYYQERIRRDGYPVSPGAAGLVRDLAARGTMLGVVSGALREEVEGALRQEGLLDRFKVLVTAEDVEEGKPSPEGYRRALEALNSRAPLPERLLHPHEVLAVEDSPLGVAAAAEAGLATLGIVRPYFQGKSQDKSQDTSGGDSRHLLRGADAVVAGLHELTAERLERLYAEVSRR